MVVEPVSLSVGTSLGVAGLLAPAFSACKKSYKLYKSVRSFGGDFDLDHRKLQLQVARLEACSKQRLGFLRNDMNPFDENDEITKGVIIQLAIIKQHFDACTRLIEKYQRRAEANQAEEVANATPSTLEEISVSKTVETTVSNPLTTSEAPFAEDKSMESVKLAMAETPANTNHRDNKRFRKRIGRKLKVPFIGSKENMQPGVGPALPERSSSNFLQIPVHPKASSNGDNTESAEAVSKNASGGSLPDRSLDPAGTLPSSISPSILDSKPVSDEGDRQKKQAEALKTSTSFIQKVRWSVGDKATFKRRIKELRLCIEDLESLLEYRTPKDASQILGPVENALFNAGKIATIQEALDRLHKALASACGRRRIQSLQFAVQLFLDSEWAITTLAAQEDNLDFRNDVIVFVLQGHVLKEDGSPSVELLAETCKSVSQPHTESNTTDNSTDVQFLQDLPQSLVQASKTIQTAEPDAQDYEYEKLGAVSRPGSQWDFHNMFFHTSRKWYFQKTLDDILDINEFRDRLNASQRAKLATLLATNHLYFAHVRSTCTDPILKPACYRFYSETQEDIAWDDAEPFVMNPYISIGFGSPPPKLKIAAVSGVSPTKSNPVVELGLLLFQIGSSSKLDYGSGGVEGLRRVKKAALQKLHRVGVGSSPRFAEIVQMCLEWRADDGSGLPVSREDELEVVRRVVTCLRKYENDLV